VLCGPNPKTENGADIFEAISAPALVRRDLEACLHRTVYTDQVRNAQAPYTKQSHAHNGWPTTSGTAVECVPRGETEKQRCSLTTIHNDMTDALLAELNRDPLKVEPSPTRRQG